MKNIGKILLTIASSTLIISGIQVNGTGSFQADGGSYVTDYNVIGTTEGGDEEGNPPRLIETVKTAVNRVLGILGLIALILCLWGGFQMLIAAGDDAKVKTGTKVLKHAAIGLAVIGLAWILVSFIFRLINRTQRTSD